MHDASAETTKINLEEFQNVSKNYLQLHEKPVFAVPGNTESKNCCNYAATQMTKERADDSDFENSRLLLIEKIHNQETVQCRLTELLTQKESSWKPSKQTRSNFC